MNLKNIQWVGKFNGYLKVINQSVLPHKLKYIICRDSATVYRAIKDLKIRGAPAIGIATAYGIFLGIRNLQTANFPNFYERLDKICHTFSLTRPTAVNLFWALDRIKKLVWRHRTRPIAFIKQAILQEAHQILKEDRLTCYRLGQYGAKLIKNGYGILTHCNAGALATAQYGTALAALYQAKKDGKRFCMYATETRPLLQGARLTTWELQKAGIDVTLICDSMVGKIMSEGKINCVLVGADRIASNGDTANKIGTYALAILARHHRIPFYVVAPSSSFDLSIKKGNQIPIEYRSAKEVILFNNKYIAPRRIKTYNPAFDITPAKYITAIVTEYGIIYPPYYKSEIFQSFSWHLKVNE